MPAKPLKSVSLLASTKIGSSGKFVGKKPVIGSLKEVHPADSFAEMEVRTHHRARQRRRDASQDYPQSAATFQIGLVWKIRG
jgi:hypothetical protein